MLEIKEFVGKGISSLSFTVQENGVFGVLCADAEQRRELAYVICGCVDANGGTVSFNGVAMSRSALELKKKIRLVPESLVADGYCNSVEYLDFVGQTLGVESEKRYRQIKEALELVGMDGAQSKLLRSCSGSELCRVAVAAALIGNPEVIVLEEPFAFVDDATRKDMYAIVSMLSSIKTVVLITGAVADARALCDNVAIISGGRSVLEGRIEDIETKLNETHETYVSVRGDAEAVIAAVRAVDTVVDVRINSTEANGVHYARVEHYPDADIRDKLFSALAAINAPMLSVREVRLTLEDVYYSLTSEENAAQPEAEKKTSSRRNKK